MIKYVEGDATQPQGQGTRFIVHCCNDIGGWGSGFVVALSNRWKEPEQSYRQLHDNRRSVGETLRLGEVDFVAVELEEPMTIVCNLIGQHGTVTSDPTNTHPVKYDAIYEGLSLIGRVARVTPGASLHMPRMGAGLAGGSWKVIEALVEETCGDLSVTVYDLPTTPPVRQEESFHDYAARWFPHHNGGLRP